MTCQCSRSAAAMVTTSDAENYSCWRRVPFDCHTAILSRTQYLHHRQINQSKQKLECLTAIYMLSNILLPMSLNILLFALLACRARSIYFTLQELCKLLTHLFFTYLLNTVHSKINSCVKFSFSGQCAILDKHIHVREDTIKVNLEMAVDSLQTRVDCWQSRRHEIWHQDHYVYQRCSRMLLCHLSSTDGLDQQSESPAVILSKQAFRILQQNSRITRSVTRLLHNININNIQFTRYANIYVIVLISTKQIHGKCRIRTIHWPMSDGVSDKVVALTISWQWHPAVSVAQMSPVSLSATKTGSCDTGRV